jgi:thiol-disulfide isomerase/thioredoxin
MKPRQLVSIALIAALVIGFALFGRAPATSAEAAYDGKPEVVAATFASSWCSSCKILKPKLAKVIPDFSSEPVTFIEFDFTFGPRDELKDEAEAFGLGDLYENNKGATGFTVLVDADTGEVLDTLTMNFSEAAMRSAIGRAIAIASHTDEPAEAAI